MRNHKVYKHFMTSFIDTIDFLEKKFLTPEGEVIFLFDNYASREELKAMLKPLPHTSNRKNAFPTYKASRKSARLEFYNSLDLLRFYYLRKESKYHTVRIPKLEADDLVKPCLEKIGDKRVLLVTNDSDWTKYLSDKVSYLPEWREEPLGPEDFNQRYGFYPTEDLVTLYKILYGDDADNINSVFPEFEKDLKQYILTTYKSTSDFMFGSISDERLSPFSSMIKDREKEIRIAYQMISSIPVGRIHLERVFTSGKNAKYVIDEMNLSLYGEPEESVIQKEEEFEFGRLDTPRRTPKEF